jgi:hypothetical protein
MKISWPDHMKKRHYMIVKAATLAEWILELPARLATRISWWRFRYYDDHCWCLQCEKRRAEGYQNPMKGKQK